MNAEVLARGQYATAKFQRPAISIKIFRGFSLDPRANAESVPEMHVVLHASLTVTGLVLIRSSQEG